MSQGPQLSAQQFEGVFPFYLALDGDLRLTSWGESLGRICPHLITGDLWTEHFSVKRPHLEEPGISGLISRESSPFLLEHGKSGLALRGQILVSPDRSSALFLGMPWVTSLEEIQKSGMQVKDFPVHTPLADLLFVIQGQQKSLQEAHDLSARLFKSQQFLSRAKEDAEAAAVAKDAFLANISHEIRTPLNGIMGVTRLLRESLNDDEQREYADLIERSSKALLIVFEDVLELSEIRSGKLELNAGPFGVHKFLEELVGMYSGAARAKGIGLRLICSADLPRSIHGDAARLRQVLNSLIGNALKFTEKGEVIVAASIDNRPEDGTTTLDLRVTDSGVGIPRESIEHIFDAFVQADETPTRRFGGSGLGLAICRRLVSLMAGTIQVESVDGNGATFRVRIPTRILEPAAALDSINVDSIAGPVELLGSQNPSEAAEPDQSTSCPAAKSRGSKLKLAPLNARLLLVEDSSVNQLVAQRLLTKLGYSVDCASDGLEAISAFRSQTYDLILMDLQMPHMDGFAATKRIRAMEQKGARVPIVALTANALPEHRLRCLENGMDDFVSKPFDFEALAKTIAGWIDSRIGQGS